MSKHHGETSGVSKNIFGSYFTSKVCTGKQIKVFLEELIYENLCIKQSKLQLFLKKIIDFLFFFFFLRNRFSFLFLMIR